MVEFALVVSLLFLIVFGIVEFSRLLFAYGTMAHGVREGARFGIVHSDYSLTRLQNEVEAVVQERMLLIGGTATVIVTTPIPDPSDGAYFQCPHYCAIDVRAESRYDPWIPLIPEFDMVAQARMHFE